MHKIVRLGTVEVWKNKQADVFAEIKIENGNLSIWGVEGPQRNGNCLGSCGQIEIHLKPEDVSLAPNWTRPLLENFLSVWRRWHLNDMRAECEHQRARGETWKTHPSAECPDCHYKLGHEWLREEIPPDVISFLESLPETDLTPAWV
jgi:hypothetical protein